MTKIVQFTAENVKKLRAVQIKPDGSLIVIGGKNAQGKSSVLDAIMAALGGKSYVPEKAVREGAKKGFVELDLGDLTVRRTFTASGGGTLTVSTKDGAKYSSPQKMLDALVGKISFDPLAFARMSEKDQINVLRSLTGLDFSDLQKNFETIYQERRDINRDIKKLEAQLQGMDVPDGSEALEPVSIVDLVDELKKAQEQNRANDRIREELSTVTEDLMHLEERKKALLAELEEVTDRIKQAELTHQELLKKVDGLQDIDVAAIQEKIEAAESINEQVKQYLQKRDILTQLEELRSQAEEKTKQLQDIEKEKRKRIEAVKLPVPGLFFDDEGIVYNGVPFSQASDAEKLRVSVALGLAMNPKLKVLLVKEGSLLDEDNLKLIAEMAEEAGAQVWLERVGEGKEMSVIIEDGQIKQSQTAEAA
jgi:DNA repair exonuclease SbcCD ATPase subunit